VLTYLALSPHRSATRDNLIELLWADLGLDRARPALRQTIWFLRQKLGGEALDTRDDTVCLTQDLIVDSEEFIQAIRGGQDKRALSLYRGKFFPAFAAGGGAEFEQWADVQRARLHAAYERTTERYVANCLARSDFAEGERTARAWRDIDRGRERAWRLLLETLGAAGNHESVQLEADALEITLAADGRELQPATRELLQHLLQLPEPSDSDLAPAPGPNRELVGRTAEFGTVLNAWREARSGYTRHVHVSAPEGFGKTRLLRALASRMEGTGSIEVIAADAHERTISYAFVRRLARTLAALPGATAVSPVAASTLITLDPTLSERFPGVRLSDHAGAESPHFAAALSDLLDAVSHERPLALLMDDVDNTDESSRPVLVEILERLVRHSILIVTTGRRDARVGIVTPRTATLPLHPIDDGQIAELLQSLAELPPAAWVAGLTRALRTASGGSPRRVLEVLARLHERDALCIVNGTWRCSDPAALEHEISVRAVGPSPLSSQRVRSKRGVLLAGVAMLFALLVPLVPRLLGGSAPSRLTVVATPIARIPGTGQLHPAPTVERWHADGGIDSGTADTVTAELAQGRGEVVGVQSVTMRDGRAVFDDLRIVGSGEFVLRFISATLETVETPQFWIGSEHEGSTLHLIQGRLNRQTITPERRRVIISPGDSIVGELQLEYTSRWGAASVMLAATTTWGDPPEQVVTVGPLATPVAGQPRSAGLRLAGPDEPGTYRLILVFQAEPTVDYVLSGTNWTVGRPVWGDGNDVARWTPAQFAEADRRGQVLARQLWPDGQSFENYYPATTIEVVASH
jgi:DNA-binding SARP family transcriptional activator